MEYYKIYGGKLGKDTGYIDEPSNESTTEEPTKINTGYPRGKGTEPSEFKKAINKGYFNKGEGSEYISNMPKAEDFSSFEEYNAALRKYKMDNPGKTVM